MNLHKIARVTRIRKLSKAKILLVAAAVTWSALNTGLDTASAAQAARIAAFSGTALTAATTEITRLSGIPYRNRSGQVVVSGSKSDSDYLLTGYEKQAQAEYDRARAGEPAITMDMLEISDDLGTSLEGLEYSVKTASSVSSKIQRKTDKALKAGEQPKTAAEYVQESGDLVRYTEVVPHNEMAGYTRNIVSELEAKGYSVDKVDNKYLDKDGRYKAVHLDVTSPRGIGFEVQIHSSETLAANKATHEMYEQWRRPETSEEQKKQLYQEIKAVYDALPEPENIMSLENYTRKADAV